LQLPDKRAARWRAGLTNPPPEMLPPRDVRCILLPGGKWEETNAHVHAKRM
jgi:hypothetical protein